MREIKFRAWDTKNKRMWSAEGMGKDELTINPDGRGFVNVSGSNVKLSRYAKHLIPLQYTGLKDKNDKEIWEGDIIKLTAKWKTYSKEDDLYDDRYKYYVGVVKIYSRGVIIKVYKQGGDNCYITDEQGKHILNMPKIKRIAGYRSTIMGNRFENPELIKEENHGRHSN